MKNYFVTLVYIKNENAEGDRFARSTAMYDNVDVAEAAYHQAITTAINKPEYEKAIVMMYDEDGKIEFKRVWKRNA